MSRAGQFDQHWQERYADMVVSAGQAMARVRPGQRIFIGTGCAHPLELVKALVARGPELGDNELVHLLTEGEAPYATRELSRFFHVNSLFIGENVRPLIQQGLGDYTPVPLSEIPRLFASGRLPLDVALVQVTPPDDNGWCSLGVSVDIVKSAVQNAGLVVAEVNPRMPHTRGNSLVSVHELDLLVAVDRPVLEVAPPQVSEEARSIGEQVAALIEDGSTIEVGIGEVPQAVLEHLHDKRDLGVHTEMFTDSIIELIESGAVTGARKTIDRGKVVASFCMGSRRLYDYIDDNPLFSFQPTEYVNDTFVIGKLERMVAINTALEVDLTGQVCADSLGTRFYSGIGGRNDFNLGAIRSRGGKAITALVSTAEGGKVSRIVAQLSPGAGVVTTRGDVHYVVTEYGVAYLYGKSIQERALSLIGVAHPRFRAPLLRQAIACGYVRPELADLEGRIHNLPPALRAVLVLDDGTAVTFRPVLPTDEQHIKELFYSLSQQSVFYRWMSHLKRLPEQELRSHVLVDHRSQVALAGVLPAAHGDEIIAVGGYFLQEGSNRAEVALVVRDDWQSRGIGTFLLRQLVQLARRNGIAGFSAEVLRQNQAMQKVFNEKSGCRASSHLEEGVWCYLLDFD